MRLIDADDLKKTWYREHNIEPGEMGALFVGNNEVPKFIDRARTIDPVRHGRWKHERLPSTSGGSYAVVRCSACEYQYPMAETRYCPNCGARMDGESDG